MIFELLLFPVSGALIGWLCGHFLAERILPRLIETKRLAMANDIAIFAAKEVFSTSLIFDKIATTESFAPLMPVIEEHIDDFLRNRLKIAIPMIGMMIGERTITQLKMVFMQELDVIFPVVMRRYVEETVGSFDVKSAVEKKLLSVPREKIAVLLFPVLKKYVIWAAILTGFVTGLVNMVIAAIFF